MEMDFKEIIKNILSRTENYFIGVKKYFLQKYQKENLYT